MTTADEATAAYYVGVINRLLATGKYEWARATLVGILTTIDHTGRVTPNQKQAVDHNELVMVEAKSSTGRLRPEQRELQTLCRQAGVQHITGGYNAVVAWLLERRYATRDQFPHYRLPPESR